MLNHSSSHDNASRQSMPPSSHAHQHPHNHDNDRGAESIIFALTRFESAESREFLKDKIDFWQESIKGKYQKHTVPQQGETIPEQDEQSLRAERIQKWYWKESQSRSYQAPNWRITPERAALFHKFRSDPNYHIKNLVEVVSRVLVEETLRSCGEDAHVVMTSDSDDVFSGVDLIVEQKAEDGSKHYTGIDIAISENPRYLEKKALRTETTCREFNSYKRHGNKVIAREVFAIPPRVMAGFLSEFMDKIANGDTISPAETMLLLEHAKARNTEEAKTVSHVRDRVQDRVSRTLH